MNRWHDVILVDPWPSEQKVVRSVRIYDVDLTSDLRSPIWQRSLIFPIGRVLLALNPKMLVSVALSLWAGIDRCSMTRHGMMLSAEPGSTWMRVISVEPIYPVKYKGRACLPWTCMSSGVKTISVGTQETFRLCGSSIVEPIGS